MALHVSFHCFKMIFNVVIVKCSAVVMLAERGLAFVVR